MDERVGIIWPEELTHGGLRTPIMEAEPDEQQAIIEQGMLFSATYVTDPPTILYTEKIDPRRRDNDICHELVHQLESDVLGFQFDFDEGHTQATAAWLHSLLEQVLVANGVDPYESGLEVQRTTSMLAVASRRRDMAEALAARDGDGTSGPLGSAAGADSCRWPDEVPRCGSEIVSARGEEPGPPGDEG